MGSTITPLKCAQTLFQYAEGLVNLLFQQLGLWMDKVHASAADLQSAIAGIDQTFDPYSSSDIFQAPCADNPDEVFFVAVKLD